MTQDMARLTPEEVATGLADGTILLIDVREPAEFVAARIAGALLFPLSSFDARLLPHPGNRKLVFLCKMGGRSQKAFAIATAAGHEPHGHLEGGMIAWAQSRLEYLASDPATGAPVRKSSG